MVEQVFYNYCFAFDLKHQLLKDFLPIPLDMSMPNALTVLYDYLTWRQVILIESFL